MEILQVLLKDATSFPGSFPWLGGGTRLLKDGDYFCFDDIIVKIKGLPNPEREMIKEVITLCKLILVNPATSAAGERSFSTARRLKTWLRPRMNQERFSNLTVLNIHKERMDRLSTIDIANEFTDRNNVKEKA